MSILARTVIFVNSLLFYTHTTLVNGQDLSNNIDLNNPINVENPQNKQNFIQQCSDNIKAEGISTSEANSYCQCSADAVYRYQSGTDNDISSDGAILEAILKCRVEHIKN